MADLSGGGKQRSHDPYVLPPDLPVPVDDGACRHLPGLEVPSLRLFSSHGERLDVAGLASALLVLFCYPRTGTPGVDPPAGWDSIPGARGCTPQACTFRDEFATLRALGASVFGLSSQTVVAQQEFATRVGLPYSLLSDPQFLVAAALRMPTFKANGVRFYSRVTLVARASKIRKVFYPVFPPDRNARDVVDWLQQRGSP